MRLVLRCMACAVAAVALAAPGAAHAETVTVTGQGGPVPDNSAGGASFDITVPDLGRTIAPGDSVTLALVDVATLSNAALFGPYGGLVEFSATLEHVGHGQPRQAFRNVLNQDGLICVRGLNGTYTFRSGVPATLRAACGTGGASTQVDDIPPGTYRTTENDDTTDSGLSAAWSGQPVAGTWRLHLQDVNVNTGAGQFVMNDSWSWRLDVELAPPPPPPPAQPSCHLVSVTVKLLGRPIRLCI